LRVKITLRNRVNLSQNTSSLPLIGASESGASLILFPRAGWPPLNLQNLVRVRTGGLPLESGSLQTPFTIAGLTLCNTESKRNDIQASQRPG